MGYNEDLGEIISFLCLKHHKDLPPLPHPHYIPCKTEYLNHGVLCPMGMHLSSFDILKYSYELSCLWPLLMTSPPASPPVI